MIAPVTTTADPGDGTYCGGCGYDLRGADGERCPECGLARDAVPLALPWERRRELGRVRSFVRTAWRAAVRPRTLARLTAAGADLRSARRFRAVVLTVVWAALTGAFVVLIGRRDGPNVFNLVDRSWAGVLTVNWPAVFWSAAAVHWGVLPIGLGITLWLGTAWDHWFAVGGVSAEQRGRAMIAGRYTVAPLLGLVPSAAVVVIAFGRWAEDADLWATVRVSVVLTAAAAVGLSVLLVSTTPVRFAWAVPGGGVGRALLVLVGTAVQWVVAVTLGLGAFPAAVGFVWVVVDSLRG